MGKVRTERDQSLKKRLCNRWFSPLSLILLWFIVIAGALTFLWSYENSPGVAAAPPSRWPETSRIIPRPGQATLVMLTHPHRPCTRASIEELDKLMGNCQGRVNAHVVIIKPPQFADGWVTTDLWRHALRIPGVSVLVDENGSEAKRFGAATSGQVILYSADGRLLFSGGITSSRGHVGDNAGRSTIESLVNTGAAEGEGSLVFGCPLFNSDSECRNAIDEKVKD